MVIQGILIFVVVCFFFTRVVLDMTLLLRQFVLQLLDEDFQPVPLLRGRLKRGRHSPRDGRTFCDFSNVLSHFSTTVAHQLDHRNLINILCQQINGGARQVSIYCSTRILPNVSGG